MKKIAFLLLLVVVVASVLTLPHREEFTTPLYARLAPQETSVDTMDLLAAGWLHVEVETNWAWFWQKSKGRAWVTMGQRDTLPADVGKLCIQLTAHETNQKCEYGKHEITIEEKKRGVQIAKRTAIVSAWAEVPDLDTVTVSMEP